MKPKLQSDNDGVVADNDGVGHVAGCPLKIAISTDNDANTFPKDSRCGARLIQRLDVNVTLVENAECPVSPVSARSCGLSFYRIHVKYPYWRSNTKLSFFVDIKLLVELVTLF